jgi:hypothetical protein
LIFHAKEARPYALLLTSTSLLFFIAYFELGGDGGRDAIAVDPPAVAGAAGLAILIDLVVLSQCLGAVVLAFFFLIMAADHVARRSSERWGSTSSACRSRFCSRSHRISSGRSRALGDVRSTC